MSDMNLLFIADIVGKPGRTVLGKLLGNLVKREKIDFVIANGENAAGGLGLTPDVMDQIIEAGVDVITAGNHIWRRKEILERMSSPVLLRPANYPPEAPGRGWGVFEKKGKRISVINLQGRVFMDPVDCPFRAADRVIAKVRAQSDIIVADMHAEATSEKLALARYLDGKLNALIGTHTHVQTSDARILPGGTAFITDAGMTGSTEGIIGVEKEEIIKKFITGMPFRFKVSTGAEMLEGAIVKIDMNTCSAKGIKAVRVNLEGEWI
ncbi:MAG: TIGR00282 family metallophosphoesterase [Elusimicrobiota bacterium]